MNNVLKPVKLITESPKNFEYEIIKESSGEGKPQTIKMKGVYIVADKVNGNGRVYPYDMLKECVDKFITESIDANTALEELEHPEKIEINPQRVCCRTLSLEEDKNCWIGTSVVLASDEKFGIKGTPCGDLLKSLLQFGTAVGHSTRGVGDVDKNGVVTDYQLICIDTVLSPSVGIFNDSNASRMVDGILESKRFLMDMHGNIFEDKYGTLSKRLSKTPNTFIKETKNQHLVNAINEFLNSFIK